MHRHLLITGLPGVGKTTLVQASIEQLQDSESQSARSQYNCFSDLFQLAVRVDKNAQFHLCLYLLVKFKG